MSSALGAVEMDMGADTVTAADMAVVTATVAITTIMMTKITESRRVHL
jgi:hypothetical protein